MRYIWNLNRDVIAGNSGSGKTELALHLLKGAQRKMIVDSNLEIALRLQLKYTRNLHDWSPDVPVLYPKEYTVNMLDAIIRRSRQFTNICLLIDDIDLFSAGQFYMGKEINNAMINIRHQNIGIILTMKRIVNIPYLIPQQANHVYLFNVNALDHDALEGWNRSLNYEGDLNDLHRLGQFTFATFEPVNNQSIHATDPKHFAGFGKLAVNNLTLKHS